MNTPPRKTNSLNIIRIIARLNIGGPARHAVILDEGLSRLGFRTLLVYGTPQVEEGSLEELVKERSLRFVRIPELGRKISPFRDLVVLVRLSRLLFREQPDVVHTHTAKAGALGRLAAAVYNATRPRRTRCLVVHTFHGHVLSGYFGRVGNAALRLSERALALVTDQVITISTRQQEDITRRFRVAPPAKTVIVPLGLDLTPLSALARSDDSKERFGFAPDTFVFGYVGRFVAIKDLDTLLGAFARVAQSLPNARLALVGDGVLRAYLGNVVSSLGIVDRVRFVGWRLDLAAVYSAFDALVLSSRSEGTPVAVIEAMAAGVPVVATAVGGVADVLDDGRCGLLVPARDPDELARAMTRLVNDPDLRRELGSTGQRSVAARFRSERLVDDIARLYEDGVRRRRGSARDAT
jgi:glycosyltransferase involved in cell wall biosynthesis